MEQKTGVEPKKTGVHMAAALGCTFTAAVPAMPDLLTSRSRPKRAARVCSRLALPNMFFYFRQMSMSYVELFEANVATQHDIRY